MASAHAVPTTTAAEAPRLPRIVRLALALPGAPWKAGAVLFVAHLALALGIYVLTGRFHGETSIATTAICYSAWFAYWPLASHLLVRGARRDVRELAATAGWSAPPAVEKEVLTVSPRAIHRSVALAVALTVGTLVTFYDVGRATATEPVWAWVAPRELVVNLLVWVPAGWGFAVAVRLARRLRDHARLDLVDLRLLDPVTRGVLRVALWWLLSFAVAVPMLFVDLPASATRAALATVAIGALLSLPLVAIPLAAVRARIRADKARELAAVRRQIAEARAVRQDERLPGLLAWETRIDAVREWPLDAGALQRLGLYLLIPLASWVGAALVERVVDAALR